MKPTIQQFKKHHDLHESIAYGSFAKVYADPRDHQIVYKIVDTPARKYKFKKSGYTNEMYGRDAYYFYIKKVIHSTTDNPYLPMVLDFIELEDDSYVIAMEKLNDLSYTNEDHEPLYNEFSDIRMYIQNEEYQNGIEYINELIEYSNFAQQSTAGFFDLHGANFMVRGNSQLVLTDPVA